MNSTGDSTRDSTLELQAPSWIGVEHRLDTEHATSCKHGPGSHSNFIKPASFVQYWHWSFQHIAAKKVTWLGVELTTPTITGLMLWCLGNWPDLSCVWLGDLKTNFCLSTNRPFRFEYFKQNQKSMTFTDFKVVLIQAMTDWLSWQGIRALNQCHAVIVSVVSYVRKTRLSRSLRPSLSTLWLEWRWRETREVMWYRRIIPCQYMVSKTLGVHPVIEVEAKRAQEMDCESSKWKPVRCGGVGDEWCLPSYEGIKQIRTVGLCVQEYIEIDLKCWNFFKGCGTSSEIIENILLINWSRVAVLIPEFHACLHLHLEMFSSLALQVEKF